LGMVPGPTPNPLSFEHPPSIAFYPAAAEAAEAANGDLWGPTSTIVPPDRSDVHQQLFCGTLDHTSRKKNS